MIFCRINIYQKEISCDVYATTNSRNMTNSGTASQILKHSTKILKKGLAWSDSDACYCSSSQTSKLQQNMQWVTITFPHQNIHKNQGLYSSTVQKINTCTKNNNNNNNNNNNKHKPKHFSIKSHSTSKTNRIIKWFHYKTLPPPPKCLIFCYSQI